MVVHDLNLVSIAFVKLDLLPNTCVFDATLARMPHADLKVESRNHDAGVSLFPRAST